MENTPPVIQNLTQNRGKPVPGFLRKTGKNRAPVFICFLVKNRDKTGCERPYRVFSKPGRQIRRMTSPRPLRRSADESTCWRVTTFRPSVGDPSDLRMKDAGPMALDSKAEGPRPKGGSPEGTSWACSALSLRENCRRKLAEGPVLILF